MVVIVKHGWKKAFGDVKIVVFLVQNNVCRLRFDINDEILTKDRREKKMRFVA